MAGLGSLAACLMLQTRVSVRPSVAETLSGTEECPEWLFRSSSRLNDCDLIKEARIWEEGGGGVLSGRGSIQGTIPL